MDANILIEDSLSQPLPEDNQLEPDEPATLASPTAFEPSPEYLQRKLYFLLEQLKIMHAELPQAFQMRIPYEVLTALANCLLNDTIFEIVKRLMEIQHVNESHLLQVRQQLEEKHQNEIDIWRGKIQDNEELEHILHMMKLKHSKELKEKDMELVLHLDQKVTDQQSTMRDAGVPGFYVTDKPREIKLQMHMLDFILRLSRMKFDGGSAARY